MYGPSRKNLVCLFFGAGNKLRIINSECYSAAPLSSPGEGTQRKGSEDEQNQISCHQSKEGDGNQQERGRVKHDISKLYILVCYFLFNNMNVAFKTQSKYTGLYVLQCFLLIVQPYNL